MNAPNVKIVKTGEHLCVYATDKFEAQRGADALSKRTGGKILSKPTQIGAKWVVTVEDALGAIMQAEVVTMSGKRIIRAKRKELVQVKVQELCQQGANILQMPYQSGDEWLAVVDCSAEVYKW